jgi:hypothetical protein
MLQEFSSDYPKRPLYSNVNVADMFEVIETPLIIPTP